MLLLYFIKKETQGILVLIGFQSTLSPSLRPFQFLAFPHHFGSVVQLPYSIIFSHVSKGKSKKKFTAGLSFGLK